MRGFKGNTDVGLLSITSKLIFSIISKIPVKKGVIVIKIPIVWSLFSDLRKTSTTNPKANET